jgi:hypothetical protein
VDSARIGLCRACTHMHMHMQRPSQEGTRCTSRHRGDLGQRQPRPSIPPGNTPDLPGNCVDGPDERTRAHRDEWGRSIIHVTLCGLAARESESVKLAAFSLDRDRHPTSA